MRSTLRQLTGLSMATLMLSLLPSAAHAEIVIDRTRVIYPAQAREVTVNLTNEATSPRLVQVWIDQGDAQIRPEDSDVPFTVNPPIRRMEAGKGLALRLLFNPLEGKSLPTDRESVFWLNVLAIRPKPQANEASNALQFAFRTRIKVFLRPDTLRVPVKEAPDNLKWRRAEGTIAQVEVNNPSPYHVTLSSVAMTANGTEHSTEDPPMLAPFTTLNVRLSGTPGPDHGKAQLNFTTIDDNGNTQSHNASL